MDPEKLDEFKRAVNRWLLPLVVFFFNFPWRRYNCGLEKHFLNNFVFPVWACAAGFNNNNNINNVVVHNNKFPNLKMYCLILIPHVLQWL